MIKLQRPPCPNPEALKTNYKYPENRDALRIAANDKCMYCESKISQVSFAEVEHIKPKAPDKYPHLEFVWNNLGYVCQKCNNTKSDKFNEELPYIDPYCESPSNYLYTFGPFLFQKCGNERGESTIKDIGLNRVHLIEKRQKRIDDIQKIINACYRTRDEGLRSDALEELKEEALPSKEYSLFIKTLLELAIN